MRKRGEKGLMVWAVGAVGYRLIRNLQAFFCGSGRVVVVVVVLNIAHTGAITRKVNEMMKGGR